jgi:polysaccharide export outer membrane protein
MLMAGCSHNADLPPGTLKPIYTASPVVEKEEVSVPSLAIDEMPPADYIVGPNDIVYVNFPGKADLASPPRQHATGTTGAIGAIGVSGGGGAQTSAAGAQASSGAASSTSVQGNRVDSLGYINIPLVGRLKVGGQTTAQIQDTLQEALKKYIKKPEVDVEVTEARSQPLYLIGQFKVPGVHYLDRPVTLVQGIALGGGVDVTANLRTGRLVRNNKIVPIDINEILFKSNPHQNVWLKGGDTIFIPDIKAQNVFVFGAVKTPGPVPFPGQMTLPQALSASGFGELSYDPHIRIIRSLTTTRGELIVVDFDKIMNGRAMPFMLSEGDIIYVPRSLLGNWNVALNEMLPSLQALAGVMQPFVQLKYLMQKNN